MMGQAVSVIPFASTRSVEDNEDLPGRRGPGGPAWSVRARRACLVSEDQEGLPGQ